MSAGEKAERRRVLELAGLLGGRFPRAFVGAVLGTEAGLLELMDEGVVVDDGNGWLRLKDAKEGVAVLEDLGPGERRERWLAVAETAEALRLEDALVAGYFESAQDHERARRYWIRSAERACDRKAYEAALDSLERALAIWPWTEAPGERVRMLRELGRCAANAGDPVTGARAWAELADYARDRDEAELLVAALGQLARLSTDPSRTSALLKEAADHACGNLAPGQAVRPVLAYVDHLAGRMRMDRAGEELKRAVAKAEAAQSAALLSEVRGWQGLLAAMSGRHEEAMERVAESLRIAVEHDLHDQAALAYRRRANIAEYASDYLAEVVEHRKAIQYCEQTGAGDRTSCLGCLSYACYRTGDWKEALASAKAVRKDLQAHPALRAMAECVEGLVAAFRGERGPAQRKLKHCLRPLRVSGVLGIEFFALKGLAFLRLLDGQTEEATAIFDEARALWQESEDVHDILPTLLFAGGHYAKEGEEARLADCIDIASSISRRNPLDEATAVLTALGGERAHLKGNRVAFVEAMAQANAIFKRLGLPLEQVWTASSIVAVGGSRTMDADSLVVARRLGLRPFLGQFAGGEEASDSASDLTPRQEDVLCLLAEGLTSKEMADRLGLSPRTVEMHVSRLLQRLNCRTRPEAVRLATERGWLRGS